VWVVDAVADPLADLSATGVSIWLDDLSRLRLTSGTLLELVRDRHVVGVTSNPTIFAGAISGSDRYDAQVADLALRGVDVDEALRMLTTFDVRWAADVLRPAYDASDGVDGRVSIEVDPRLAHGTAKVVAEACHLWWLVDRPNLFIKIPDTDAGPAGDRGLPRRGHQRQRHPDCWRVTAGPASPHPAPDPSARCGPRPA